ncbi:MAG: tRNA (adenosine(37)-N6)-dimethylallyltransferase MiaA [Gammaproteobacteria bacterium]|nr:tRNA (adenosine(37)-N6)-dimethylallyltransferase MiaA [Gammaproteobacteria bacterium]
MQKKPLIICLMGPTASGKTQLAVDLVQHFPIEIISVDSALVYKGMDIGTAKPTSDILKIAPHRLLDIRDPADAYSAADFCIDALREIEAIIARGHTPLLVGGTMLYFRALQQGLSDLPSANESLRASLAAEGEALGWPAMHDRLRQIDLAAAERIHPNDAQRIQRALEVYELTGKNLSSFHEAETKSLSQYRVCNLAVTPLNRAILHERIQQRFSEMLEQGFIDEVKALFVRNDLTLDTPAIRSVGYRQVWEYLQGKTTYDEMREKGIIATRQLAKRQLTWLRHWSSEIKWFDSIAPDLYLQVEAYLKPLLP